MKIEVKTTLDDFIAIKDQWNALYSNAIERYPMLSHTWLCAWWEAFAADCELYIVLARDDSGLCAAAPLLKKRKHLYGKKRNIFSFLSNTWVDRINFLLRRADRQLMDTLVAHLFEHAPDWDLLELGPMDSQSITTKLFIESLQARKAAYGIDESLRSPCLSVPDSWDALLESLSASFRQTIRRKIKKSTKHPGLHMEIDQSAAAIDKIMDISLETWQHDNGTSMASTPAIKRFYTRIIEQAAENGTLYAGFVHVEDKPVAFEFNLLCDSTVHNFKLGFRKDYHNISSGAILKSFIFNDIIERNRAGARIHEYDFMGTTEPYKRNWTKKYRQHIQMRVFNNGIDLRILYLAIYRIKPLIKSALASIDLNKKPA